VPVVNARQWFGQARRLEAGDTDYSLSTTAVCAVVD
jgi:hypothetical protein